MGETGILESSYSQLLVDFSRWYDAFGYINMLKVLYKDHVPFYTELIEATMVISLLQKLIGSGNLSSTNLTILYDTIKVTGQFGFESISPHPELQRIREREVSSFTKYRQFLLKLGMVLNINDRGMLDVRYNMPLLKNYEDNWLLILDLEQRGKLCEEKVDEFIEGLPSYSSVKALLEGYCGPTDIMWKNPMSIHQQQLPPARHLLLPQQLQQLRVQILTYNYLARNQAIPDWLRSALQGNEVRSQVSARLNLDRPSKQGKSEKSKRPRKKRRLDGDSIIKESLTKKLKQLYQDVNQMTPAIWHRHHKVDIADVFTQLILLKSTRKDKGEPDEVKSTCIKKEGRPTPLTELLDIIKSTVSCKVLITGEGGMGKTTLLKYITYKWTTDDDVYNAIAGKLLFLINIGDIKSSTNILEIIMKIIKPKELILQHNLPSNSVERFLIKNADDIVILLDGYDELHKDAEDPIYLFKGLELEKSTVVITSRPDYAIDLVKCCTVHIEVKGFSRRNIKEYIQSHFHSINKCELGDSLIKGFSLESEDQRSWDGGDHKEAFELCSSPLLLLMICTIWQQKEHLPKDLSDLFIKLTCCTLSQYESKCENKTIISQIERIAEPYRPAILLLGECMYEGLKKNELSIYKHVLSHLTNDIGSVDLALRLGFVYEDSPGNPGDKRERYTTPHKLMSEALAGFYLSNKIEGEHLKANEYEEIRYNEYLNMTRRFTIGFLGAKAGKLLKHWLLIRASHFCSLAQCFTHVKEKNEGPVLQELDKNMSPKMKSYCEQMRKSFISVLKLDKSIVGEEHLFKLMKICWNRYESTGRSEKLWRIVLSLLDTSSKESVSTSCRIVVHILVILQELNLGIRRHEFQRDLFEYISNWKGENLNVLSAEMKRLQMNYSEISLSLPFVFNSSFLIHLVTNSNLCILQVDMGMLTEAVLSEVIIELHKTNVKLNLKSLDIKHTDLRNIDGTVLQKLFEIAPELSKLNVSSCNLRGDIVRAMIMECQNSAISLGKLVISNNDIDDALLVDLLKVYPNIYSLDVASCGLSKAGFYKMVNEFPEIELHKLDFSKNYLGNLDGETFRNLLKKLPKLRYFGMRRCSLSGSIVTEMLKECYKMNVVLKDNLLDLSGNDLSSIDGKSLAELVRVIYHHDDDDDDDVSFSWRNYSLTAANLETLFESVDENMTLTWKRVNLNNINLSSVSGKILACLFKISPNLIHCAMCHCRLSGNIINEMMEECGRMKVVLKDDMLQLVGNDLSDIDGRSHAELVRVMLDDCFEWSGCSLTVNNLQKLIDSVDVLNETLTGKRINLSNINLSAVSGNTLACFVKIYPDLIRFDMKHCSLSGRIIIEMMEECGSMNVVLNDYLLDLSGNDLSDIDGKSLAKLVMGISHCSTFFWRKYSFTADNLQMLIESVGVINKTLPWNRIDLSDINLSYFSGKTLACLFKISPDLIRIEMRYCSLSGSIVNEMMEECGRMNVVLKDDMISLYGNDLSDINGKSFLELVRVIYCPDDNFVWNIYSLTAENLQELIKTVGENMTLNWARINFNYVNLSSISGNTLAYLIKVSPNLNFIDMEYCSLSGRIISEMIEECCRMNVVLKDNMLKLVWGNDLSDIEEKSFPELVRICDT